MRLFGKWRSSEAAVRAGAFGSMVYVVGMKLQCEVCGVPLDSCRVTDIKGAAAWVEVQPCGHRMSIEMEREKA